MGSRGVAIALAFGLLGAARGAASASPMEDPSAGGAVFTGPNEPHASSIFINPAVLVFAGRGLHLYAGSSLRLDTLWIDRDLVDPDSGAREDGPSVTSTTWSPGGTLAISGNVLNGRAVFGMSLNAPFVERFVADQDALRYHVQGGYIYQGITSFAGGFRLADFFVFGLGLSIGYTGMRLDFQRDTALEAGSDPAHGIDSDCAGSPCGFENRDAAETYRLHVNTGGLGGWSSLGGLGHVFALQNFGATFAVAVQVKHDWWVTMSYVSPPGALPLPGRDFDLHLKGSAQVQRAPRDGGAWREGRAEVTLRMPQSVWIGVRGPVLDGVDLVTSARWQNMSRHDQLEVRLFGEQLEESGVPEWYPRFRGFRDEYQVAAGLEQQDGPPLRLGGRLHLASGAVARSNTSPMAVDWLNAGAGAGAELRVAQHIVLGASYDLTWFPRVDGGTAFDPIARVDCVDSGYDFDECRAAREGRAIPTAAGTYDHLRQMLLLSLRYDSL